MAIGADLLWLSVSPALERFDRPLMQALSREYQIRAWQYSQSADEPLSLEVAVDLLHTYLADRAQPVHLIGHGTSGLLALLYARAYPQWVCSLTLLSVGVNPALDWQAHYYSQTSLFRCSRCMLLAQIVYTLFGRQSRSRTQALIHLLDQDLATSLSPHTLAGQWQVLPAEVPVPVCICGGEADPIIDPAQLQAWKAYLDLSGGLDRIWQCPAGGHFFHSDFPALTGQVISRFWQKVEQQAHGYKLGIHGRDYGVDGICRHQY